MKKKTFIYFALGMALLMSSCGKDLKGYEELGVNLEYEAIKSELDVNESSFSIDGSEQTIRIRISSNSYWAAETKSSWLYLEKNSGHGNSTLSLKVYDNPSITSERKDVVNVTNGIKTIPITIIQAPATEKITLSVNSLSFKYGKDNSTVYVTANSDWTVSSDASWCQVEKYNSNIRVVVYDNDSYTSRTATITVKGKAVSATIMVSQAAAKEPTLDDLQIMNITKTSADCKFTFNSSDLYVQQRGICYSTTKKEPTISDENITYTGSNYSGTLTCYLTNLKQNTSYYVRPYVTTSAGTTYGKSVQFTTLKTNSPGEGDNPTPTY
jgi:hypothetical protein